MVNSVPSKAKARFLLGNAMIALNAVGLVIVIGLLFVSETKEIGEYSVCLMLFCFLLLGYAMRSKAVSDLSEKGVKP